MMHWALYQVIIIIIITIAITIIIIIIIIIIIRGWFLQPGAKMVT